MTAPGPPALGRGVVVGPGAPPPPPWADAPRVTVGAAEVADPGATVDRLHEAWAGRSPVVIEAAIDPATYREPAGEPVEPWRLHAGHEILTDRLHFLVWANTYDARHGEPVWWWARKAARLGATETPAGPADVALADGTPAWVDGGPRDSVDAAELAHALIHSESVESDRLTTSPPFGPPSADLAPDQLAAVAHRGGPARVIAPAGSGKTRVLTERLRHLLADRAWERESVLAVAYNVRARQEMEARTEGLGARVLTLNALAYRVLAAGLPRQPRVLDEPEVRSILDDLIPRRGRPRLNTDPIAPYLEALTEVRLALRDPVEVEAERGDVPGLGDAFPPYRQALADRGAVDFDEQVYRAVELLLADGPLRRRLQTGHRHLLVDELQDLTPAHVLLVRLLAAPTLDVFGVGDDDQVIYGHAGADPRFLVEYRHHFPHAHHHALQVNYRCPEAVVTGATNLLSHNRIRVPKEIHPGPHAATGDRLHVREHPTSQAGAAIVDTVETWLRLGASPDSVAVLVRVNGLRLAPVVALREAGVAVRSRLPSDMLGRLGLRASLAWLRVATDPGRLSPDDLAEIRRRPSRGFPRWIDRWLSRCRSVHEIRKAATAIDDVNVAAKLEELADDIEALADRADSAGTTRQLLEAIRDDIGLGRAVAGLDRSKGGAAASHLDDLEALLAVADLRPDPVGFDDWLASHARRPGDEGGVTVATIHKVKGQEWPLVAVFGVNQGLMPHRLSEGDAGMEEERRVFHVAITRCGEEVVVLADAGRPSPFLAELAAPAPERLSAPGPVPASVSGRPEPLAPSPLAPAPDDADHGLFEALRAWRSDRSARDGVPAYVVAHDTTLREVARRRPTTPDALGRCHGYGPTKVERYGAEVLDVVRRFAPAASG